MKANDSLNSVAGLNLLHYFKLLLTLIFLLKYAETYDFKLNYIAMLLALIS